MKKASSLQLLLFLWAGYAVYAEPPEHPSVDRRLDKVRAAQEARDEANRRAAAQAVQAELDLDRQITNQGGIVRAKTSGESWSGHGADWSDWYTLKADPTPPGYRLHSAVFHLEGDRHCGAWSECREISQGGEGVTWQFRMQGHSERSSLRIDKVVIPYVFTDDGNGHFDFPKIQFRLEGDAATSVGILKTRFLRSSVRRR